MSRTPAAANCSASRSVETVAGPAGDIMTRRAASTDLDVLRWGRRGTPRPSSLALRRAMFRSIRSASRTRQGVAKSPNVVAIGSACAVFKDIAWPNVSPPVVRCQVRRLAVRTGRGSDVGWMLHRMDAAYNLSNLHEGLR